MLSLKEVSILVDAGLVVLIWLIQLVVYPSFSFYSKDNLITWHSSYTPRITLVVAPLMIAQLCFSIIYAFQSFDIHQIIYTALVLLTWLSTFFVFIPIHGSIQNGVFDSKTLKRLVKLNWFRTLTWSVILLMSILSK